MTKCEIQSLRSSFQNESFALGVEEAIAPYLPPHLEQALDAGHWTPELSLAADQAIAQADIRHALEFAGVAL